MEKTKVVIDRAKWLRGQGIGHGLLANDNGCLCFLGWIGLACGIPLDEMKNKATPEDVYPEKWPEAIVFYNDDEYFDTGTTNLISRSNDRKYFLEGLMEFHSYPKKEVSDDKREKELTGIVQPFGFDVTFVGEGKPE